MRLVPAFLLFSALGYAEVIYGCSCSIAHIAAGGGIQMTFTISNIGDTTASYQLTFRDNDGRPLTLVTDAGTTNTFFEVVFPPHTSRTIRTTGPADTLIQGWAVIRYIGSVGVSATFRFTTAPWAGSETTVPVDTWRNNRFSLAFDHKDSATTGLAIANPSPKDPIAVTVTFRDEDGSLIVADTFNLSSAAHRAILTTSSYPATAGKRGTMDIATASGYMSVLALRFGPTAISAITPLVSGQWASFDNSSAGCWD